MATKEELLALGIDMNAGIENCGGMEEFYYEIVDEFEHEEKRTELLQAYANKDWNLYSIDVHAIKGILRLLGANEVGDLAEKLQFASEAGDGDTVIAYHDELLRKVEEVISLIRSTQ